MAHRLDTVMDADQVAVVHRGRVAECGPPLELLRRPDSMFAALVAETGPEHAAQLRAQAEAHCVARQRGDEAKE